MNIIELLDEYGIEYWEQGKNVSSGWINIQCIFPGCDDPSNHLGIRLRDLKVTCWKCGEHSIIDLLREVADLTYEEAKRLRKSLAAERADPPLTEKASSVYKSGKASLPQESSTHFPKLHLDYLRSRGFKPRQLIKKYSLQAVHTIGKYKFRVIIPVKLNGRLVTFTSRDVTGKQDIPYLSASPSEGTMNIKHTVYNIDSLREGADAILCEGPADVWKLGNGSCSLFGVKHTMQQIKMLGQKRIATLFIIFDSFKYDEDGRKVPDKDGLKSGRYFARLMVPLVKRVEIIRLSDRPDPGELTLTEVEILKERMGFRYGRR